LIVQIVKPFLDPKTFRKVKFVYSKNAESQKILSELFEEDAVKSIFEDPNDYNFEEYAKLMQEDDQKSALYWKGAGENKAEPEVQNGTVPEVGASKIEEAPAVPAPEVGASKIEEAPAPEVGASKIEEAPAAPAPAAEASVEEVAPAAAPVAEVPREFPVAESPVAAPAEAGAPRIESPVAESEAAAAPVAEAPKLEAPVAEPQVTEASKVEAPVVAPVS
jgi:hypothetical protein